MKEISRQVEYNEDNIAISSTRRLISTFEKETGSYFTELFNSNEFIIAKQSIRKSLDTPYQEEAEQVKRDISGYLYEQFSYLYLKKEYQKDHKILLSPLQTRDVYSHLFPHKDTITHNNLTYGISGISVPDGIIFSKVGSNLEVEGITEYTLRSTEKSSDYKSKTKMSMLKKWAKADLSPLNYRSSLAHKKVQTYLRQNFNDKSLFLSCVNPDLEAVVAHPINMKYPGNPTYIPINSIIIHRISASLMSDLGRSSNLNGFSK